MDIPMDIHEKICGYGCGYGWKTSYPRQAYDQSIWYLGLLVEVSLGLAFTSTCMKCLAVALDLFQFSRPLEDGRFWRYYIELSAHLAIL